MGTNLGERAVVIGGGMGGLFAAAAVSEHFDEVVVLDRDDEPEGAAARKGVPQGNHFHVLLPGGMEAMTEWFPGFADDLVDAGSIPMVAGRDFYVYTTEGRSYSMYAHQPEPTDGPLMYVQTRPLLEDRVRSRVRGLDNVDIRHRKLVERPLVDGDRVVGVTTDHDEIAADLVIDASGRNSRTARWLGDLGYDPVPEEHIGCDIQYVSVIVEPDDWDLFDGVVFFVAASREGEHGRRGGAAVKLEGGRWLMMVGSRHGDDTPRDWVGMLEFGETLITPVWSECARTATPVEPVHTYRLPRATRRRYDRLDRFPDGLVPVGDSVCFFNPTYGQGMSTAAGQCRGLRELLAARADDGSGLGGLPQEFFPIANEWVRGAWVVAAMGDLEFPECTGEVPADELADLGRLGQLIAESATRPELGEVVGDIIMLRTPLSAVNLVQLA